ncbi:MAG: lysophospholipid acyltransferase family protein [Pseudomonadota bacterium]
MRYHWRRGGWTVTQDAPLPPRCVLIAVPHTSNWDFPNVMALTDQLGVRIHFMAKVSLFRPPFGRFMRQMGGVPVDRAAAGDMVNQMTDEFARRDEFVLTIAAEGTRRAVDRWRSGFYRIAMAAEVPIVCGYMDYGRRRAGLGPVIHPTGDYDADMTVAHRFYQDMKGRHPDGYRPIPV